MDKLDKALNDFEAAWESDAMIDFDAALEEHKREEKPVPVKFGGKEFDVPASMPMSVFMFHHRHVDKHGNLPDSKALQFIELVIGKEFVKVMERSDTTVDFVMNTVIPTIIKRWGFRKKK